MAGGALRGRSLSLDECAIAEGGTCVHLQGYGVIRVFRLVSTDGDTEYWATSDLTMGEGLCLKYSALAWGIDVYHRGLKQFCGVERAIVRAARAQRNHVTCTLRAFLRLEQHRLVTGVSRKPLGQLAGRNEQRSTATWWGYRPGTPDRALAEWIVAAPAGTKLTVTASHDRAGTARAELVLKLTK